MVNFEALIWYILLLDSLVAAILSFFWAEGYRKKYKGFYKHFPVTKGWCVAYLVLVLWTGSALDRLGVI